MPGARRPRKPGGKWRGWYIAEDGRQRYFAGAHDKATTLKMARKREDEAKLVREGLVPPGERQRREAALRRVADHIEDYRLHLLAKGDTHKHAKHTSGVLRRLLDSAGVVSIADIDLDAIQGALGRLKASGRSARTCNHARGAILGFVNWLHDAGRIAELPRGLRKLATYGEDSDRRRERRAISGAELDRLLAAAEAGEDQYIYGPTKSKVHKIPITGPERAALYRLAMATGFRANELRSLTPESFSLDGDAPTVTVEAGYSKNGRKAVQPIARDVAAALRPFVQSREPGRPVLIVPERTAQMLRRDLEAAGIPYRTEAGVLDFHALRGSYVTHLILSGVDPKTVQELARHSTVTLTIGRYTRTSDDLKRKALEGE